MEVRVRLVGFRGFSHSLVPGEIPVRLQGRTLGDLMEHLVREYGTEMAEALLDEEGELDPAVQVIRNGEQWLSREDLSAELQEGDRVVFLLLVAGG
ncbi:MAG: MoaD/ThiS family protein [Thermodesulfobacteriota bacterium]